MSPRRGAIPALPPAVTAVAAGLLGPRSPLTRVAGAARRLATYDLPPPAEPDSGSQVRHITCTLCEASCGLEVQLDGDRITSIRGHEADPLSRGHICPKGVALQDLHADPERLRRPLLKVDGEFVEIGWDEAIDRAAAMIHDTQAQFGKDAVALYLGNPNVHSLGALTHGIGLARQIRSKNTYSATSVDQLPHQLVAWAMYGHQFLLPVPDIDRTDLLVLIGTNPMASNGSLMTVPDFPGRRRELRARGGRLIVLDPRRTETAKVADEHHFVRPGSDAAVVLAMVHVVLAEGLATPPPWVEGVEAVRAVVDDITPGAAERMSGMPAAAIETLAREVARAPSAAVHARMGASTQEFGVLTQWAVQVLTILTGNLDRVGGTMFTSPAVDILARGLVGAGHHGAWRSRVRGLPEFSGELPVSALTEEITTPGAGQVRALVTVAGNPVSSTPAGHRLAEALTGLDAMVSIDFYLTETSRHADLVLPPTGPLERDHYDLIFHTLAVRNTARFSAALFDKPDDARHDWEIARDLVLALRALDTDNAPASPASRSGSTGRRRAAVTTQIRMRVSPTRQLDVLLRTSSAKLSVADLAATPGGVDLGPLQPQLPGRLRTADHRVALAPDVVLSDVPRLRTALAGAEQPVAPGALLLIGRRHQRDNNSWLHNLPRLTSGRARHQLLAHPDDLSAAGIPDGSTVRVTSAAGSVVVEVSASQDMMPGVVSLPHGYGHAAHGVELSGSSALPGVSVNDLTDPTVVEAVSGNAVLNGVPVQLAPLSPEPE